MRPIHPGEILQEELQTLQLSARQLALALDVPPNRITSLLHQTRALTPDTALRLARYFETSPEFWLNLQAAYDLRAAQSQHGAQIAKTVTPRVKASA
jgi:addiction module HigA family antidote